MEKVKRNRLGHEFCFQCVKFGCLPDIQVKMLSLEPKEVRPETVLKATGLVGITAVREHG